MSVKVMTLDEAENVLSYMGDISDDIPIEGEEFAESVIEKTESILESCREKGSLTLNQSNAINNMLEGLKRWIR